MDIADRMKLYEKSYNFMLPRRLPVIVRCDGKRFSKATKKLDKPSYDFIKAMSETTKNVASSIDGCVFAYTQSDEISFVLCNDKSLEQQPWLSNRLQKIASIMASETTYYFMSNSKNLDLKGKTIFDARAFVLPNLNEVVNYMIWRNQDCIKNSISMVAYYKLWKKFGKADALKMLHGKKSKDRKNILLDSLGIDFEKEYLPIFKLGSAVYKVEITKNDAIRNIWKIDEDIPSFLEDDSIIRGAYGE